MSRIKTLAGKGRASVVYFFWYIINRILCTGQKVSFGRKLKFVGRIRFRSRGKIVIEDNVKVNSSIMSDPLGGNTCSVFVTTKDAEIRIGEGSGLSNTVIFSRKKITIGENVFIGAGVCIYDTDFHPLNLSGRLSCDQPQSREVSIENGAFIGAHSIILKGVTIGEGSVIGAGSVVTKNVPPMEIWAGNPARYIRRNEDST